MNGEDLLYDYQHNVVREPSEWAFHWDYAEGGTSQPTPRPNHRTVWLVMNLDNPAQVLRAVFTSVQRVYPCKLKIDREEEDSYKLTVTHKKDKKKVLLRGKMGVDSEHCADPNVGNYAVFQSTTEEGAALVKKFLVAGGALPGHQAYVSHSRAEVPVPNTNGSYRVVTVTGFGPDWNAERDGPEAGLATRFTLYHEDEEVARCHMSYRDGSWDASLGPTIEMLAVKQSRRGEGLAKVLFYFVRLFIEEKFTIECLNNDAPLGHIMIKASQIGQEEVDIRKDKDGNLHPVGFKELLYDYCGFSVREQKGAAAYMFSSRRPKDEEAVLYIPFVTPESKRKSCPKPGEKASKMREKTGDRCCQWCSTVKPVLLRCTRCGVSFYCNASCQKQDWKRHKKWCNKTRKEVRQKLIEDGLLSIGPDGQDMMHMNMSKMNSF